MILGHRVKPPSAVEYPLFDEFSEENLDINPIDPLDEEYIDPIET